MEQKETLDMTSAVETLANWQENAATVDASVAGGSCNCNCNSSGGGSGVIIV